MQAYKLNFSTIKSSNIFSSNFTAEGSRFAENRKVQFRRNEGCKVQ